MDSGKLENLKKDFLKKSQKPNNKSFRCHTSSEAQKNEVRLRNINILVSFGVAIFQKDLGRIKERESI